MTKDGQSLGKTVCHVICKNIYEQVQYLTKNEIAKRRYFAIIQSLRKKKRTEGFCFSSRLPLRCFSNQILSRLRVALLYYLRSHYPLQASAGLSSHLMILPTDRKFLLFCLAVSSRKCCPQTHVCKAMPSPTKGMEKS